MTTKKQFWHMYFRPTLTPANHLPFGARSVGHFRWPPRVSDGADRVIHFVQIFWGIKGTGALIINGKEHTLGPRQIAVYLPGMEHRVATLDETWEYRWWTMDGPFAASLTMAFGFSAGVFDIGSAPEALFRQLEKSIRKGARAGETWSSTLAFQLLTCAAIQLGKINADNCVERAVEKIHKEWNNPDLNVNALAQYLRVHRSSLSRCFHQQLGISPMVYIHDLRIKHAFSLLKQKTKSIKDVAFSCGFRDPHYFSRIVHNATGISPKRLRSQ